ncbi:MAG TPA: F0F1 ATP synthase subunit epsilon [Arachidicoccus soli]|nr:F0F1 ATP synthase subunit epsilon [Arachidicoccus soli]
MHIEIITPEKKMFEGEANAARFPGINGSFQVLNNHASITSALKKGKIKIDLANGDKDYDEFSGLFEIDSSNSRVIRISIKGVVMEMQNNKVIVLAD